MKLVDNIYCYIWRGWINNCNCYLIEDELLTLIDTGLSSCLDWLGRSLEQDGFKLRDLDLVLNTHLHPDHCQANAQIQQISRAKLGVHPMEERYFRSFSKLGLVKAFTKLLGMDVVPFRIDFHLGDRMSLGNTQLQILHTPGHTPGSISLYDLQHKLLICGDLIFEGGVGRWDLPGGNLAELRESISKVSKLELEYILPGHGEILKGSSKISGNFKLIREIYFEIS